MLHAYNAYTDFGAMVLACSIVPSLSTDLPLAPAADAIALVGLFAAASVVLLGLELAARSNVQAAQEGLYSLVVSNAAGRVVSAAAALILR